MFLSFAPPGIYRYWQHPDYLWVLLKQARTLGPKRLVILADDGYFKKYPGLWNHPFDVCGIHFRSPSYQTFSRFRTYRLNPEACSDWQSLPAQEVLRRFVLELHPGLTRELEQQIRRACQEQPIRALLSWTNAPSLEAAARACGLPVIYNEVGPLRRPFYRQSVYFDFQGVNAGTAAEKEARIFYEDYVRGGKIQPLALEQIQKLFLRQPPLPSLTQPAYAVGVPLQVPGDSNVTAYGRGFDMKALLERALQDYPQQRILVRKHPDAPAPALKEPFERDTSASAYEFIRQCACIYTLNSSVAFECLLFGKPVRIFGESPARFLSVENTPAMTAQEYLSHLNYLFLCYLVPERFLFDSDYYNWRLTKPPLGQIFTRHLEYWKHPHPSQATSFLGYLGQLLLAKNC